MVEFLNQRNTMMSSGRMKIYFYAWWIKHFFNDPRIKALEPTIQFKRNIIEIRAKHWNKNVFLKVKWVNKVHFIAEFHYISNENSELYLNKPIIYEIDYLNSKHKISVEEQFNRNFIQIIILLSLNRSMQTGDYWKGNINDIPRYFYPRPFTRYGSFISETYGYDKLLELWRYEKAREKNDIEKYMQNELCYV